MKIVLALALALLFAPPAFAQGYQGKSDDYVCNRGDPADPATSDACARLRGPGASAGSSNTIGDQITASTSEAPAVAPPSPEYRQGQSDRRRFEAWQGGLSGDTLAGAAWWAAHRSLSQPGPCTGADSAATSAAWSQGCAAAQRQLANSDRLRHSSTDYRQGWNHPSDSGAAAPEVVASAAPAKSAAAAAVATDVGESPLGSGGNAVAGADNTTDQGNTEVSINGGHWPWHWLHALAAMGFIAVVFVLFSGLAIYFIPTLIAMARRKRNALAIFALNLFLGWSFIGWVAALIWSLATDTPPRP